LAGFIGKFKMRTHGLKHGDVEFRKRVEPDLLAQVITIKSYWVAESHLAYNLMYSILPFLLIYR